MRIRLPRVHLTNVVRALLVLGVGVFYVRVGFDYLLVNDTGDIQHYLTNMMLNHQNFDSGDYRSTKFSLFYFFTYSINLIQHLVFSIQLVDPISVVIMLTGVLTTLAILPKNLPLSPLLLSLPLLLMCLFTPRVLDLLISNLRHGFAVAIFLYSAVHLSGVSRRLGFLLSLGFHIGMGPIWLAFTVFHFVKNRCSSNYYILFIAFLLSVFLVCCLWLFYQPGQVSFKAKYIIFSAVFALTMSALAGAWIYTLFGFIFVSLTLFTFMALLIDIDVMRYFGVSIILFSTFVTRCKGRQRITLMTVMYAPFLFIYLIFWLK